MTSTPAPASDEAVPDEAVPDQDVPDQDVPDQAVPDEAVFVEVLTDEELSVLERPGAMAVMPFLDELGEHDREVARRSAYRSLLARGIVDPPTPESISQATAVRDGSVDLMVRQDVSALIALREGAEVIVAIARTTATTQDFWYAHLVQDVVLIEEVSKDGLHRFALQRGEDLVDAVLAAAVHPDSGDAVGEPVPVTGEAGDPTPPDVVLEALGAAFVRADLIVRRVRDHAPPAFTVFSGPEGCWLVSPDPGNAAAPVVAEPVSAQEARDRVTDAVDGVRAEMEALRG